MSYYLKSGDAFWPTQEGVYDVRDSLPVGTYTVGIHPERGWFLKPVSDFEITGKIYGKTNHHAERILSTFASRPNTTGVLLNGEKGSGKTMLAKMVSEQARNNGISTLIINSPYCGDSFNNFIQSINEPCVIIFDEFEKVFDEEQQELTLTLLDGVYPSKKLFMLTVNDKYRVNQHMRNRPGRIFYMLDFKGLDADFIREYCNDRLDAKEHIEQIVRLTMMFDSFNFDMLKALVEEMNRYKETPNQVMEMLNAKPYDAGSTKHFVTVHHAGKEVTGSIYPQAIRGNPLAQDTISIHFDPNPEDDDSENIEIEINPTNLKRIDPEAGTFTYVLEEGTPNMTVLTFTRESYTKMYDWREAI